MHMTEADRYFILIILCALVIFSYIFDMVARKTRFPSVLLLMFTGIVLQLLTNVFNAPSLNFLLILPTLGTVGLILIVLEGALELRYKREKNKLILHALLSSLSVFVLTALALAFLFYYLIGAKFSICLINAIPYSLISSAIAIPSSKGLSQENREFVVYESTFSDIIGVLAFNFMLFNQEIQMTSFLALTLETIIIIAISLIFCLALLYFIRKIKHQVKFFLIIAIIILVYSGGHLLHLPSLILVLLFGLFLNNAEEILPQNFQKKLMYPQYRKDLGQFYSLSAESAFLIRTFFFIIFGFIIDIQGLGDQEKIIHSLYILGIIYFIRALYLKFAGRLKLRPLLFLNPRGLISILLLLSLPQDLTIPQIDSTMLFLVVLGTSLIMSVGLVSSGKSVAKE
jgi:hypothetical protein